jgi:hypothetical protein
MDAFDQVNYNILFANRNGIPELNNPSRCTFGLVSAKEEPLRYALSEGRCIIILHRNTANATLLPLIEYEFPLTHNQAE